MRFGDLGNRPWRTARRHEHRHAAGQRHYQYPIRSPAMARRYARQNRRRKSGIIKPGVPVITATDEPEALAVIEKRRGRSMRH